MKLAELIDLSGMEKNAERLKKKTKQAQTDIAKAAEARLKMQKDRQEMIGLNRSNSTS